MNVQKRGFGEVSGFLNRAAGVFAREVGGATLKRRKPGLNNLIFLANR
jgi:hypothetical protein